MSYPTPIGHWCHRCRKFWYECKCGNKLVNKEKHMCNTQKVRSESDED